MTSHIMYMYLMYEDMCTYTYITYMIHEACTCTSHRFSKFMSCADALTANLHFQLYYSLPARGSQHFDHAVALL